VAQASNQKDGILRIGATAGRAARRNASLLLSRLGVRADGSASHPYLNKHRRLYGL
jgi:hypothetical protein